MEEVASEFLIEQPSTESIISAKCITDGILITELSLLKLFLSYVDQFVVLSITA